MAMRNAFHVLGGIFKRRKLKRKGLSAGVKRKTGQKKAILDYLEGAALPRFLTGLAFACLAVIIIWSGGYYYWPRLTVGQRAMEDVYASIEFSFRDDVRTDELKREAEQSIPTIYKLDETLVVRDFGRLLSLLKTAKTAKDDAAARATLFESIREQLPLRSADEVTELIETPAAAAHLERLQPAIVRICQYRISPLPLPFSADQAGIRVHSVSEVQTELRNTIRKEFPPPVQDSTLRLLEAVVSDYTNIFQEKYRRDDLESARRLQAFAVKAVPLQFTSVAPGTKIVERGEEITPRHIVQIEEMRKALSAKRSPMSRWLNLAGTALAVCALLAGSAGFLAKFHAKVFVSNSRLLLIALSVLASIGLSKLLMYLWPASVFLAYPIALPFGSFVLSMLLGLRLTIFAIVPMALFLGMGLGSTLSPVLVGILGGWAAAFIAGTVRHRKDFIRAGVLVGLVNGLTIAAIGLLSSTKLVTLLIQSAGGVAMGVGCILLASMLLPVLEWAFKIPTSVTLVELTDSTHPVLKRLVMEAPGTYYHSLMVGNLAEAAAEAVGANPLLARVGSYYHDIGKLKKPLYFSENEAFGKSKHDTLHPSMSNLIILSHVKDGVDLACKQKLNRLLTDIIREHHGTSLDSYFYHRAEQINGDGVPVDEKEYRYPGPRPQNRESAIIMLADSAEAASRSLEKPTTAKIRATVRNIIHARFEDGQLDECDLTLKDLHKIEGTFSRILVNTLHPRVKYPGESKEGRMVSDERPVPELAEGSKRSPR
jgi:cyclic-di-AMP phosphodiesterase PgpH